MTAKEGRVWRQVVNFDLLALEVRLTPLDKGLEAFLRILALQDGWEIRSQAAYRFLFTARNGQASGCQRSPNSQWCLLGDRLSQFFSTSQLLAWLDHFLYQPDPPRFMRIELIARKQIAHGIAPTGFMNKADSCSTYRVNAALNF